MSKVLKSVVWYTATNFISTGISFLMVPIYTRLLNPSEYGNVSLYFTWLGIFTIILPLNVHASIIRGRYDFASEYEKFLSSILSFSLIPLSLFSILILAFHNYLVPIFGIEYYLIFILIIHSFFNFVFRFAQSHYTANFMYRKYSIVVILNTTLTHVISVAFILKINSNKSFGRILGAFIISIIIGAILFYRFVDKGRSFYRPDFWKYALKFSVPLIPHNLSGIILSQFDRILINFYESKNYVGIYSFAYTLGTALNLLWSSLNRTWVPWFISKMDKKAYSEIYNLMKKYIAFFTLISIGAILISPDLVSIFGSVSYSEGKEIIPIVMGSYYFVFLYSLPANYEFYIKKTYYISIGTLSAAAINIILNIIFIPLYGYTAAAWTTLTSYIFLMTFHYILAKILGMKFLKITPFMVGSFIVILAIMLTINTIGHLMLRWIVGILSLSSSLAIVTMLKTMNLNR